MPLRAVCFTLVFILTPLQQVLGQSPDGVFCESFEAEPVCEDGSICISENLAQTCNSGCPGVEECAKECVDTSDDSGACISSLASCQEVKQAFDIKIASRACNDVSDCHVVYGWCGNLGGCYELTNTTVTQDSISGLTNRFDELDCGTGVACACIPPPEIACVNSLCEFLLD